jgi:MFS family permease
MKTRYFTGAVLARAGDEMTGPAVVLLAFAITRSPGLGAVLMASLTVAAAVGGPAFGVILDRSARPERALGYALAGYAAGILTLQAVVGRVPLVAAAGCALAAGSLSPAVAGGWTSQLPTVVTPAELPRASALDAMSFSAASLAGPALAALVTLCLGARPAVAISAGLVGIAVPAALGLVPGRNRSGRGHVRSARAASQPAVAAGQRAVAAGQPADASPGPAQTRTGAAGLARDMLAGLAAIASRPALLRATVTSAVSYIGIGMLLVCCPLLGEQRLGGPARGALLLSAMSATSLAVNALLARRRWRRGPDIRVFVSTLFIAASMVMAALAPGWFTMLALAVDGAGEGPQLTAVFTVRHREAPEHLRGRIFTTAASLKIGGIAIGAALAGPLAGSPAIGVTGCLLAAAAIEACAAGAYLLIRVNHPAGLNHPARLTHPPGLAAIGPTSHTGHVPRPRPARYSCGVRCL